jgi:DNA-binding NarL/FixJ family response regulator
MLLEGIGAIFGRKPEYIILAKGTSSDDAVSIALEKHPDVIVLDLNMPGNAFEAIQRICELVPQSKVVVFTAYSGIDHAVRALEAGATGYVLKGAAISELAAAIEAAAGGDTFITPGFATKVIAALRKGSTALESRAETRLSIREEQILHLLHKGKTNKEIAVELNLSEKTVKHYMTLLMQKLQVKNRVGVILASHHLSGVAKQRPLFN